MKQLKYGRGEICICKRSVIKVFLINLTILFSGLLIGILVYYALDLDLGKMKINNDIKISSIFLNNLLYFMICMFGFVTIGLANITILLINGGLIGFFLAHGMKTNQFLDVFLALAPHSIIEIICLLISSTYSYIILIVIYKRIFNKQKIPINLLKLTTYTFIGIVLLTYIGSLVEKYITLV
ncbi:stage II sporulation protein M [Staphylococcus simulans]|uniref:stage II sporulation protein M n=1 Tax=Staphylococcus simulans TaxID=1286 RepID=UPI0037422735